MAESAQSTFEGRVQPGMNPNVLNAKARQGARPKVKNSSSSSSSKMNLGWIDPLPVVNVIHPLGLEPNPEAIPAGEIELDFDLPMTIAEPFAQTINSVGDRIQLVDDDKETLMDQLRSLCFFKAARQLYSTMLDHEKAVNQPLKAVFYDETPVPSHMAGALGIIGHMETKVGTVMIRDAGLLFKRWVAQGLHLSGGREFTNNTHLLVWPDKDSYTMIQRVARDRIAELVKATYTVTVGDDELSVSMPQLVDQDLGLYYGQINDQVPDAETLRLLVSALQMTFRQYRDDDEIPNDDGRSDILRALNLRLAPEVYSVSSMREHFENWCSTYITDYKWRIESIFKVGPPPAGTTGYGAQTVSADGNTARWQFPLSDADLNIGYLFSPMRDFKLYPRMVGYSKRSRQAAAASFAAADGRAFTQ